MDAHLLVAALLLGHLLGMRLDTGINHTRVSERAACGAGGLPRISIGDG